MSEYEDLRNRLKGHKDSIEELHDPFYGYPTAEEWHKEDILGWYLDAVADFATALERLDKAEAVVEAAGDLHNQIAINDFKDSIGHSAKMLQAFADTGDALATLEADGE